MKKTTCAFAFLALLAAGPALAAEAPQRIGEFGAWGAFTYNENESKVCFMSAQPEKQDASVKNVKRSDVNFFITHWSGEGSKNVVSISFGYPFAVGAKPEVTVDGKTFSLFTDGEQAWAQDQTADDDIALAVRRGSKIVVKGTSKRGTKTTDTYSLKGSDDAYKAISQECGL
jgi:hypothetical protein